MPTKLRNLTVQKGTQTLDTCINIRVFVHLFLCPFIHSFIHPLSFIRKYCGAPLWVKYLFFTFEKQLKKKKSNQRHLLS